MYWSRPTLFGIVPPKLRAHVSVVYEDKMFVFGGAEKSQCSDTLYVFDLDTFTWSKPLVYGTCPPACRAHSLIADQENGKLVLFGGGNGQQYYHHLYMFDVDAMCWDRIETVNRPPERRAHVSMIWHHHLYVFGGGDGTKALNDVYKLNLDTINDGNNNWEKVNTKQDTLPDARGYHTGTLVGDKWVIFGGSDGKECFGSCHVLDLIEERWFDASQDVSIPRLSHSALCVGSFLFVMGGHDGTKYCNNLMMLNLVNMNWETRRVYGHAPTPRGYHSAVLYDGRIVVYGGYNGHSFFNDVYILELSSFAYLPQIVQFNIGTQ
ncbi:galactose oxidase [Backusella circina FSU 941]|nr:galactose oxidase [Backusella circina FSU 941]